MRNICSSLLLGLALSSCQISSIENTQQGIIGGSVASPGQFRAVGALAFDFGGGGQLFPFCTGTLISPSVVLTAAHCVDPELAGFNDLQQMTDFTSVVFDAIDASGGEGFAVKAQQLIQSPLFDVNNLGAGNDVGIILLQQPVNNITPLPFNRDAVASLVGNTFTAVGYGATNEDGSGSGTQRFVELTLLDFDGQLNFYGNAQNNVCFGDSGGPDIMNINGQDTVIGIHSFVSDPICHGISGSQRTDTQQEFIDAAADAGSCEADGFCSTSCGQNGNPVDPDCAPLACGADDVCQLGCGLDGNPIDPDCAPGGLDDDSFFCSVTPATSTSFAPSILLLGLFGLLLRRRRTQ